MNAQQRPTPLALVTGASSGIGYQYARLLAEIGYDLLLVSNEELRIAEVARELRRQFGVRADGLCRDLSLADARSVAADPADQTSCKILPLWKISRYTSLPEPAAASARR